MIFEAIKILLDTGRMTMDELQNKVDMFLLFDRISAEEYLELTNKHGYHLNRVDDHIIELVPDEAPAENDGSDYTLAIMWHEGDPVTAGLWYTFDDGNVWDAIKDGVPSGSMDAEYFGVIQG